MANECMPPRNEVALREWILARGCYSPVENQRIYEKWFRGVRPRDRLLSALDRRWEFSRGAMCDVGCSYGMHVLKGGPGSYGIEMEPYQARFARSIGLTVYSNDVLGDDLSNLPRVQTVLALAVIEHVDSPHVFLRKIHGLLEPGGLLVLETPRKPSHEWLERTPFIGRVYGDHDDHVSAFTSGTIRFACERAGFRTLAVQKWSMPLARRLRGLTPMITGWFPLNAVANGVVYIGSQIPDWQYGPESTRRAALNPQGYTYCGSPFPEKVPDDTPSGTR